MNGLADDLGSVEPTTPPTTDGRPPRLSHTCSLCRLSPLVTVSGSDVLRCGHCDLPCPIGPRRGCVSCLNGAAS